jgi:hypothetical protein
LGLSKSIQRELAGYSYSETRLRPGQFRNRCLGLFIAEGGFGRP